MKLSMWCLSVFVVYHLAAEAALRSPRLDKLLLFGNGHISLSSLATTCFYMYDNEQKKCHIQLAMVYI